MQPVDQRTWEISRAPPGWRYRRTSVTARTAGRHGRSQMTHNVCAGQRIVQVGLSPTRPVTTGRYPKAGVIPRRPAQRRRTGCPPRGGIRRVCGESPGRSRWGLPQGRTGRPKVGNGRACTMKAKAFGSSLSHQGVCGRHGEEEQCVTPGELAASPQGSGASDPISVSEMGSDARRVVGRPE